MHILAHNTCGWRSINRPEFDTAGALMILHDLLDHLPNEPCEVQCEIQAQATYLFRYQHIGIVTGNVLAHLLPKLFRHFPYQSPKTESVLSNIYETSIEETLTYMFKRLTKKHHIKEEDIQLLHAKQDEIKEWLRIGILRAEKRFGSPETLKRVHKQLEKLIRQTIPKQPSLGDTCCITIDESTWEMEALYTPA